MPIISLLILSALLLAGAGDGWAFSVDVKHLAYTDKIDPSTQNRVLSYDFSAGTQSSNTIGIPDSFVTKPASDAGLTYTFGPYPDPSNDIVVALDTGTQHATLSSAAQGGCILNTSPGMPDPQSAMPQWEFTVQLTNFAGMTDITKAYSVQAGFGSETPGPHPELTASWIPGLGGRRLVLQAAIYNDATDQTEWARIAGPLTGLDPAATIVELRQSIIPGNGSRDLTFEYRLGGNGDWIALGTLAVADANPPLHLGFPVKFPFVALHTDTPSNYTLSFAGLVMDAASNFTNPVADAAVSVLTDGNVDGTVTGVNGGFLLTGIPQGQNFELEITKTDYTPVYSEIFNWAQDLQTLLPYGLFPAGTLPNWGVAAGNGAIIGRVSQLATPLDFLAGATVTAVNAGNPGQSFPVVYQDPANGAMGGATTYDNGVFVVLNVPAGTTVQLTAAKPGWTFMQTASWLTVRDGALNETSFFATAAAVGSISGQVVAGASGYSSGNIIVVAYDAAWPNGARLAKVTLPALGEYTLPNLPTETDLFIYARWDTDGSNSRTAGDWIGQYPGNPVAISNGVNPTGIDITLNGQIPAVAVAGSVNSSDFQPGLGDLKVFAYDGPDSTVANRLAVSVINSANVNGTSVPYTLNYLPGNTYVYIVARWDRDGDGLPSPADYRGGYALNPLLIQTGGHTGVNITLNPGLHQYVASGTYVYVPGTSLTLNTASSDFVCQGPPVGVVQFEVISVTATTATVRDPYKGELMNWTRTSGTDGDIVGTWQTSVGPNLDQITFNNDLTYEYTSYNDDCSGDEGPEVYSVWTGVSRSMTGAGTTDITILHFHLWAPTGTITQIEASGPSLPGSGTQIFTDYYSYLRGEVTVDDFSQDIATSIDPVVGDVYNFTVTKADSSTVDSSQTLGEVILDAPLVTAPTGHTLADANLGGTLNITWTLPAGIIQEEIMIQGGVCAGGNSESIAGTVTSATTGTVTLPNPVGVTGAYFDIRVHHGDHVFANTKYDFGICDYSQDTIPPAAPANLTATAAGPNRIDLAWDPATDNIGVEGYTVYRGGFEIGTTVTPSFSDGNLGSNTSYCYTVKAYDRGNNVSDPSNEACALTGGAAGVVIFTSGPAFMASGLPTELVDFEDRDTAGGRIAFAGNEYSQQGITFSTPNSEPLWVYPADWYWNSKHLSPGKAPYEGGDSTEDSLTLVFDPAVTAIGWTFLDFGGTDGESIRVYAADNSLIYQNADLSSIAGSGVGQGNNPFWGIISDTPIARVEIVEAGGDGDDVAYDNFRFSPVGQSVGSTPIAGYIKHGDSYYNYAGIEGVAVVQGDTSNSTVSGADGRYDLTVPSGIPFYLTFNKNLFVPTNTALITASGTTTFMLGDFFLYYDGQLAAWGVTPGQGIIRSRIRDQQGNNVGGATVTAFSRKYSSDSHYTVCYDEACSLAATDAATGLFYVKDVDPGDTVTVSAAKEGWTFGQRVYQISADTIHQGGIRGVPVVGPDDEATIRTNFQQLFEAFNNSDIDLFMTFVSADFLDDGMNYDAFRAEILSQFGTPFPGYVLTVIVNGNMATTVAEWDGGDSKTLRWIKENDNIWRLYGNQQKYGVEAYSGHTATSYWVSLTADDPADTITSVSVTGPGITGSLELIRDAGRHQWISWNVAPPYTNIGPQFGLTPPTPPLVYTFSITDNEETTGATAAVTGFVEPFATPLSPAPGATLPGLTAFGWTGQDNGYRYGIELNDSGWTRLWGAYGIAAESVPYDGPVLAPGLYHYNLLTHDSDWNFSMRVVDFTVSTLALQGDINGDGKVDMTDAIMALKILDGFDPVGVIRGSDVNGDGRISMAEILYIIQLVAGLRTAAPAPSVTPYTIDANTILLDHLDGATSAEILAYRQTDGCGSLRPAATPVSGYGFGPNGLGQALTLSPPVNEPAGSGTYLKYPGGQLLSQANGTIEFWVYLTAYGDGLSLVEQGPYPGSCAGWTFAMGINASGQLRASAWAAFDMNSGAAAVPLNTWAHVAASWGNTGARLYLNGILVGSDSNTRMPASGYGGSVMVNYGARDVVTRIDELRISNIQRLSFSLGAF